ncbi:MAG TPA: PKD domain-containing protein, partial [Bacteroidota bacterium]|nr:PKD domain-containing protein [Bacteroidota bacterium]
MAYKTNLGKGMRRLPLLLIAFALTAGPSYAATYYLRAGTTDVHMPDGATIPMWGFACDSAVAPADCPIPGVVTVPGPALAVPADDTTLTINLTNDLAVPVSIVIPGQTPASAPVITWIDSAGSVVSTDTNRPAGDTTSRARSFATETAAGPGGGPVAYTWSNLKPGTYLYHSGTHPQVQVQMGLYGAVTKPAGDMLAYPGVGYDLENLLLFSEIDPALHDAVAGPSPPYGTSAYPSTIVYQPKYFLINGAPYTTTPATDCLDGGPTVGNRILLRMLNAGLREFAPMILESHWDVVAEGGSPYRITTGADTSAPNPMEQYTVLLPPGGTRDVIFTPEADGTYRIIDRRLNLTNNLTPDGGLQACITVAALAGQPTANANGPYSGTAGTVIVAGTPVSFSSAGSSANGGTIVSYNWDFGDGSTSAAANPSHLYLAAGVYAVSLTVTDDEIPALTSAPDFTTATITPADGAPTANAAGPYTGKAGFPVAFDGSGSSDPEGAPLSYSWNFGDTTSGTGVAPSHTYAAAGDFAVTVTVSDGVNAPVPSAATTAHITVNNPPVANPGGPYSGNSGVPVAFNGSGSSDTDSDPLTYSWNFGDGTTGTGATPSHAYPVPATYTVTLRVNDGYVNSAPATTTATITSPPALNKHVGDIDRTSVNISGSQWRATVTVT